MNPVNLEGDVAIVTGASKGLGAASAIALAQAGADVVLAARDMKALAEVKSRIESTTKARAHVAFVDITDRNSIARMVSETIDEFGKIDILVNNAGQVRLQDFMEITDDDFRSILDINLLGAFRCTQEVGRHMIERRYGRIVNMSSIAGLRGRRWEAHYSASKGALNLMTQSLAVEWARYNINVNAICPGYFQTPLNEAHLRDDKLRAAIVKGIPQKRIAEASEIGGAVVFLASRAASFVTGAVLSVDGGTAAK